MPQVLVDAQLLVGSMELSPFTAEFEIMHEAIFKPARQYAAKGFEVLIPCGNRSSGSLKGHADVASGGISQTFNSSKAGTQQAFAVLPQGSATVAGDPATMMRGRLAKMAMYLGDNQAVTDFALDVVSDAADVDGFVGAPLATRTTAGLTGTAVQLGAVPAGRSLYAGLFVPAAAGTNLAVTVQSDNASGFPSPAVQITFATMSAIGWQFLSVPGPLTDDWFRFVATIATSTFQFAGVFGVI